MTDTGETARRAFATATAVVAGAVAVAVCSAAPEFIWQGLWVMAAHLSRATLVSAVLAAVIIVFFIEPILVHVRYWLGDTPSPTHGSPRHLAVTAAVGVFIALMSVGLHDAMSAFSTGSSPDGHIGIHRAVIVTIAWGAVPFAIIFAWQAATYRFLAIPIGVIAAASSFVAGWYFNWGVTTTLTTAIPCLAIQLFGYRRAVEPRTDVSFAHYVPTLAAVGAIWLVLAWAYDTIAGLTNSGLPLLYDKTGFAVDARFYVGWYLGLVLTRPTALVRRAPPPAAG